MKDIITKNPEILGGIAVFSGTRVPVQNLIDYLAAGDLIDTFIDDFPSVSREQIINFLQYAGTMAIHEDIN